MRIALLFLLLLTIALPTTGQQSKPTVEKNSSVSTYLSLSEDVEELKEIFNKDRGKTRLLLLLSPA